MDLGEQMTVTRDVQIEANNREDPIQKQKNCILNLESLISFNHQISWFRKQKARVDLSFQSVWEIELTRGTL